MSSTTLKLENGEHTLICMAVRQWAERCKGEAALMAKWQIEYAEKGDTETAGKCGRNVEASKGFEAEAEALYKKLLAS